jgi:hypothetical protein
MRIEDVRHLKNRRALHGTTLVASLRAAGNRVEALKMTYMMNRTKRAAYCTESQDETGPGETMPTAHKRRALWAINMT